MQPDFVHISLRDWEIHGVNLTLSCGEKRSREDSILNNLEAVIVSPSAASLGQQKLMASKGLHKLLRVTLKPFAQNDGKTQEIRREEKTKACGLLGLQPPTSCLTCSLASAEAG